jgi:hypothetical protein
MPVLELRLRHIDRALMLRDHSGGKVAIDIASRRDEHLSARVADRQVIGEKELVLFGFLRQTADAVRLWDLAPAQMTSQRLTRLLPAR